MKEKTFNKLGWSLVIVCSILVTMSVIIGCARESYQYKPGDLVQDKITGNVYLILQNYKITDPKYLCRNVLNGTPTNFYEVELKLWGGDLETAQKMMRGKK